MVFMAIVLSACLIKPQNEEDSVMLLTVWSSAFRLQGGKLRLAKDA
jgi:hypothetical protein